MRLVAYCRHAPSVLSEYHTRIKHLLKPSRWILMLVEYLCISVSLWQWLYKAPPQLLVFSPWIVWVFDAKQNRIYMDTQTGHGPKTNFCAEFLNQLTYSNPFFAAILCAAAAARAAVPRGSAPSLSLLH